ncbi:HAD family hydrolase [Chryseomicrobium palamuruense]|uniref:HAD family hydrolase n=1 Tax=Chryseomicrobium palamuruense TaxID=682973 RepID=A0ABV8UWX0_9BACL
MESIIFDLDGTLWDSRQTIAEAWTTAVQEQGYEERVFTKDDIGSIMGLQIPVIAERLFPMETLERRKEIMDACAREDQQMIREQGGVLFPKLEETLKELKKTHRLFIVSNCEDGYIEAFYAAHGLEAYFEDFENPGRTGLSKGENIQLIMERNSISSAIYVGDTQGDLDAARHAGIPFVFAAYGFGEPEAYDYKIEAFDQLLILT